MSYHKIFFPFLFGCSVNLKHTMNIKMRCCFRTKSPHCEEIEKKKKCALFLHLIFPILIRWSFDPRKTLLCIVICRFQDQSLQLMFCKVSKIQYKLGQLVFSTFVEKKINGAAICFLARKSNTFITRAEVTASDIRIYLNQMIDIRQNVIVCSCCLLFELHVWTVRWLDWYWELRVGLAALSNLCPTWCKLGK